MGRKKQSRDDMFCEVHRISGYIERRLDQLRSDEPIGNGLNPGRPERDAILEFVTAR